MHGISFGTRVLVPRRLEGVCDEDIVVDDKDARR